MNLRPALTGEVEQPPPTPKGSPILCTCGRRIGVETPEGDVWAAEYQHAPIYAARIVLEVMTRDARIIAEMDDLDLWEDRAAITETLDTLWTLARTRGMQDFTALAEVLPRLIVPATLIHRDALALESGGDRSKFGAVLPAGCKKCREVYDLREIVRAGTRNRRGALLVGDCRPARVFRPGYASQVTPVQVRERVEMYRRLSAVLRLRHSASSIGEAPPVK